MTKRKVGVLISGSGSNLQALIDACAHRDYPCEIAVVISNKDDAYGLTRAKNASIPTKIIRHKDYANRDAFDGVIDQTLREYHVDFVCLAGFMRLLTADFVRRWENRLVNIHPSLLPAFKGVHVHGAVIAAGAKFSGCTVHFVRPEMDVGPIIVQSAVPVLQNDTPETLAARILKQEHRIYPLALRWLAEGKLSIEAEKVRIDAAVEPDGAIVNPSAESFN